MIAMISMVSKICLLEEMITAFSVVKNECIQHLVSSSKNLQLLLGLGGSLRLFGHVPAVHVQPLLQGLNAVLLGSQVCPGRRQSLEKFVKQEKKMVGHLVYRCCPGRKRTCARHSSHTCKA